MFGLGFTEVIVILVVALIVLGPDKLPDVARSIGKVMGDLRRTLDEVKREIANPLADPPHEPRDGTDQRLGLAATPLNLEAESDQATEQVEHNPSESDPGRTETPK